MTAATTASVGASPKTMRARASSVGASAASASAAPAKTLDEPRPDAAEPRKGAEQPENNDFEWSTQEEPHKSRRRAIMSTYKGARSLSGNSWQLKYLAATATLVQIGVCYLVQDMPWWTVVALAYCLGGTINHSQTLAMHETSHMLAFKKPLWNRAFGLFVNLPLGIPSFVQFRRYHMDHHAKQGTDGVDVDIGTGAEGLLFTNAPLKLLWVLMQPLFYSLRPMFVAPKQPGQAEAVNWAVCIAFDAAICYFFSAKALLYLILGTLLGMGLHPMAGHFIAEHYTFVRGQETYSYYGPLNWLSYSVGYHNEHHDMPTCSFPLLPVLRALAPEQYETLPYHSSWVLVIWRYITDPLIGPFSRVKRAKVAGDDDDEGLSDDKRSALDLSRAAAAAK